MHPVHNDFPGHGSYELKLEALEFLTRAEALVGRADAHPALVAKVQAYSRRNDGEIGTLPGTAELGELGLGDDEDDE